nr:uncharacterized protein LOC128688168 [Cherax quadricarinatus]
MWFPVTWFVVCMQVCGVWSGMAPAQPYMGRRKDCRCVPKSEVCAIEVLPLSVVAASSFAPYTCILGTRMCCDSEVPHYLHTDDYGSSPPDVDTLMVKVSSLERYHDKQLRYSTVGKRKNTIFNLEEPTTLNEEESEFLVSDAYSDPLILINSHLTLPSDTEDDTDYVSHSLVEKTDKYLITPNEHENLPDSTGESRDTRSESANGSLGYNYGRFIENKFNLFFTRYADNSSNSTQFSEYRNYTSVNATSTLLNSSPGNTQIQSASEEVSVNLPDSPYIFSLLATRYTDTMGVTKDSTSTNQFSISSEDLQTLETTLSISTDSTPVVQAEATLTSTVEDESDSNSSACDPSLAHCSSNKTPVAELDAVDQPEDSVASNESLPQAVFSMLVSSNYSSSGTSEDTVLLDNLLDVTTPPDEDYGFWYWFWTWFFRVT